MIKQVTELASCLKPQLVELSDYIFDNPELGYEEFKACAAQWPCSSSTVLTLKRAIWRCPLPLEQYSIVEYRGRA